MYFAYSWKSFVDPGDASRGSVPTFFEFELLEDFTSIFMHGTYQPYNFLPSVSAHDHWSIHDPHFEFAPTQPHLHPSLHKILDLPMEKLLFLLIPIAVAITYSLVT